MDSRAPARIRSRPSGGSSPSAAPRLARMNENSPICARLADTVSAVRTGCRNTSTMTKAASDLPTMMMASTASTASGSRTSTVGIEQHSHRHEEQHGEGVLERQRVVAGLVRQLRFRQDHAGEERAERERHAERGRRAVGDAERDGQHAQREQFARAGARDALQQPGHDTRADHQRQHDEHRRPWRA